MIDQYPSPNGVLTSLIWRKTAAGGETSLSGYDNANQALSYTPGQEQVYLNGILLVRGDDYTATNGTSITGLSALAASDYIQVNCYNNFSVATLPSTSITGTIANNQLQNSSITINGSAISLGGSISLPGDIESITASSPLTGGGTSGAITVGIQSASTTQSGAVQLSDSTSTTSSILAATPTAVKSAYDLANAAIPKSLTTTTGDIIYASSANTPARLGIGTSGQYLTTDGTTPSWGTISAGGMTLISTTTLTAASSITLSSIPSSYINLFLVFKGGYGVSNGSVFLRFNGDSGQNYNRHGILNRNGAITGNQQTQQTQMFIGNAGQSGSYVDQFIGTVYIPRYTDTSNLFVQFNVRGYSFSNYDAWMGIGSHSNSAAISSITIMNDGGNWSGGTVYLYGEK